MTIQVKIHNSNSSTRVVNVKSGKNTITRITLDGKVNIELIDLKTGRAPESIVAKRQGKDLVIIFSEDAEQPELIIQGYYNNAEPSVILGLAEDGHYYAYIPENGLGNSAIPHLSEAVLASEVLGGKAIVMSAPFQFFSWTTLGLLATAGLVALASGGGGGGGGSSAAPAPQKNVTANTDGSVTVKVPADANVGDKVTVEVTSPNGTTQTVELTKEQDGSWASSNPDVVPSIPAGSNSTTIPNDQVKDGSIVTAKAPNGLSDSDLARNPTPDAPTVSPKDDVTGDVVVGLPTNNVEPGDQVIVSYTKPDGTEGKTTLTLGNDGTWTSDNPAVTVGTDANGKPTATIPNTEVKDGSPVTAVSKDFIDGKTSPVATNEAGNPMPDAPIVLAPNDKTGVVTVELPTNNVEPGDQVVVSYEKPNGEKGETTLTKQPDGTWASDNPAVTVGTDAKGNPIATFPNKEIKDGETVTAVSKDGKTGDESTPSTNVAGDPVPEAPKVNADTDGGVWVIDFPDEAEIGDKVGVKFTDTETGEEIEVIFTKTSDEPAPSGTWESNDPRLSFDPTTGTVKVPNELVKDGSLVEGISYNRNDENNTNGNSSEAVKAVDVPPNAPEVLPPNNETGDVVIKLPTENVEPGDTVTIEYTKPDGTKGEATLTKTNDGWAADPKNPDVTLDKDGDGKADTDANGNPIATIPGDKVKDNTPVNVRADDETTAKGDVVVNLPEDAKTGDTVNIKYTDEEGNEKTADVVKQEDGTWAVSPNTPNDDIVIGKDESGKDIATIPGSQIQDGTSATVTQPDGTVSTVDKPTPNTNTGTSGNPEPSAPEVTANPDGSVSIKLPEDAETGDAVKVIYTNKDGETVVTTVVKDKDGTWKDTDPNTTIDGNTLTIPNDAIKDGTDVTAISVDASKANIPTDKDGNYVAPEVQKNPTEEELAAIKDQGKSDTKTTEDVLPSSPTVDADDDVGVRIIDLPKDAENGDKVVVKYTTPEGKDKIAVVEKTPDGWKPVNDSPVVAELPTDVAEGTKATVTYKDPTGAEKEATLTFEDGEWKADPNNPDVEVGKDADGKPVAVLPIATIEAGSDVTVEVEGKEPVTVKTPDSDLNIQKDLNGEEIAVLPNDKVKDGTPVTAYSVNAADKIPEDGNLPTKVNPSNEGTAPNPTPTGTEVIAPTDGSGDVIIKLPTNNVEPGDTVKVEYTKPDGTKGEATLTKTPEGWAADPSNPDVTLDKDGDGKADTDANGNPIATIPGDKVKDNTPITVTSGNADGTGTPEVKEDTKSGDQDPEAPVVTAVEDKVTIKLPEEGVEIGDYVKVGYTDVEGNGKIAAITLTKDGWVSNDPNIVVGEDGKVATIDKSKLQPGSEVVAVTINASAQDDEGKTASDKVEDATKEEIEGLKDQGKADQDGVDNQDVAPAQPTVVADEAKGVTVTMPTENVEPGDKVTVGFTKPGETTPTEVTYTAQPDGTWKVDPTDAADAKDAGLPETVAKGGEVTVPNDKVKDGSPVTAVATDAAHPNETGNTANAPDLAPAQPTVEANPTTGDVKVTMPTENVEPGDKVTVGFTKPGETTPTEVTYTAQPDGTWKVDPTDAADAKDAGLPETVAEGGDITLPNDKVKDNSPVQAVATDEKNTNPTVDDKNSATTPQISPTGLTLDPKENGDVAVNLPTTNAEPGDKVAVKVVDPATGQEETVTLTKQPDGTWESDKPSVVPSTTADNPNTTTIPNDKVKDGSKVEAVAYDEGTQPDWNSNDVETVPAADPQPTGLEVSKPDENGNVIVTLPTENVEPGDKVEVVITAPDGTETPITFEKTPEGWTVDPADKGIIIDGNTATIPKDLIPNNSTVTADTINGTDGQVSEEKEVDNRVKTEKPTVQDIFAIDTSNPADEQAEAVKVTGKTADPFSDVEIVYKGEVIGTGKSDKDGNFEITATPKDGVVLTKDEPLEVYATDTVNDKLKSDKADGLDVLGEDGLPTGEKVPVVVPEVIDGPEGHIGDRIAPNQPTLAQGEDAGSVVLTFPTTDTEGQPVQNGDIVEVNFTDEQGNKHIVLFEKVDGGWQSNNPELVPGSGNGLVTTPSVTIPADTLLDASTVAAQTRDIAGNESEWEYENAGSDEDQGFSPDPTIESVVAYDTSSQADRNPEYVHIQGRAVYPAGSEFEGQPVSNGTVTISFPEFVKDGKPVSITVNTDANGKFQLIAKESDSTPLKAEHNGITALSLNDEFDIVAFTQFQMFSHDTARGHLPSYIDNGDGTSEGNLVTGEVLPVLDGADYHIGDKALPEQPTLTPADSGDITNPDGGMKVGLPQSANSGDKVIVEFTDEENKPQKVTLTKQDDGSWKSSNSLLVPDVAPRTDEATIPEDNLLDGSTVSAYSEDLAGNVDKNAAGDIIKQTASAGSDDYNPEKTATPTYSTVEAQDTAGNTQPEKVTIVGKTEPKAEVVVTKDGVEVGKTTADDNGNFTLNIDNTNGTLATLDKLDMVATAPTKLPSDATEVSVPRVVPATAPLVTPNEGGSVVILPQGNDTKVTVKYFDEKNVEKTTVVTKDPVSGLWNISGDNTKQDESGATVHDEAVIDFDPKTGGVTIYEPSLQDVGPEGNATVVTAIGNNGNRAIYDRETKAVVKAVSALEFSDVYAKDTSVAANDEPEEVHFTIKTNAVTTAEQINTKVEIISPDGTVYNVQNVVEDKKLDGTVGITIRESGNAGLDLKVGSIVRVTQTTADRDETIKFFTVPALGEGEQYHTDVTPPEAPKVTTDGNGAAIIALPKVDTHNGDKVEVSIVPTGQKAPVTVTLTKTPDGWISDNPGLVPSTVGQEDKDTVVIPHRNIEDNSVLSAKSVGTEGKSSDPDLVQIDAFTADIDPATIDAKVINDNTPEKAVVATIKLDAMVDENPDNHNAKTLTVDLPLVKANGEKVTATVTFNVLDNAHKDGEQFFQLADDGIIASGVTGDVKQFWEVSSAQEFTLADGSKAKLDPNGVINAITSNDQGAKELAYDLGTLGYTPYVEPKTQAPSLLGEPHEVDNLVKVGEVKVTPHADNDAMQITYPVEHGNGRTEIVLAQKGANGWTLIGNSVNAVNQNGEKLVTIDPQTGVVTLHPDAVADHQRVTAIGLKTGKQPSDPASVIAGQEPQSIGEFWGTINDLLPSSPTAGRQDGQDVGVWRNGLQGENNAQIGNGTYGKSTALVSLVDQLKAANDFASENVGTSGSRTSYTLNTNEQDNIVRIYNSLGNMNTNSMDHSGVVTINTDKGNDAIVIGRDLGFSGTTPGGDRYMTVNTGEGHDVITVGATNDWFKVVQYFDRNPATGRYDIPGIVDVIPYDAQLPQNARYLPNLDLYNDVSKVRRTGGHLANANVNMGDGDDALVVSGVDSVSSAAISWSTINMGDGHNRVIVAPNGVDSSVEIRGAIAQGAVIRGGKDTDYVQAPLVYKDARIELGAGNDTVKLTKVADTAQVIMGAGNDVAELRDVLNSAVIDMGAGNDIVTMTGSFNNSAVVRLGDGNDRFNWGFKTSGGGVVDGGAGYDTISLQGYGAGDSSPVGWRASTPVSNIKTADFKNIEEVVMNGNNALDVKFSDLRDTSTHTFTLDNGEAKRAKFIVSANKERDSVVDGRIGSNKVDFGQADWNRDSDRDLSDTSAGSGGRWGDVGDVRLNGKTYDVFRHTSVGGSHEYDVLVEQGITII